MGRFEKEILTQPENLGLLMDLPGVWIDKVHQRKLLKQIILDMDSPVSPTYGNQEGSAYNGYFECTCYHPLFCFNQYGDVERALLRNGNAHSVHDWQSVLEPIIARHRGRDILRFFRGDVGFADPHVYCCLGAEGYFYAIRLKGNQILYSKKESKYALNQTRLSCHDFVDNQVRLQLFALAYNLGNFLRRLALPKAVKEWSLRTLRAKLIKIGAKIVRHSRYMIFQMAEVAVPRTLFREILDRIRRLRFSTIPARPG